LQPIYKAFPMDGILKMIAVPFKFHSQDYCTLVRIKRKGTTTEFHVTVMNGELERALYGNHIYHYENGVLQAYSHVEDLQLSELQEKIGWAIMDYLEHNPIRNDLVA
jgi:hypothetical protein